MTVTSPEGGGALAAPVTRSSPSRWPAPLEPAIPRGYASHPRCYITPVIRRCCVSAYLRGRRGTSPRYQRRDMARMG